MKTSILLKTIVACTVGASAFPAFSHIVLETSSAAAGSTYKAVFQVGHGCQGSATTGVTVQIPAGFQGARPYPKAGWALALKKAKLDKPYEQYGKPVTEDVTSVSWKAASKEVYLQDAFYDEFMLRGKLPNATGPLWFKVLQTCENGSADWSEVPASGTSMKGLKFPAALVEVVASAGPSVMGAQSMAAKQIGPVQVSDAWIRATVPGQSGSGAFMKIMSKSATRLVGVSTPVAGVAEVHEMKMEGNVMKMAPVAGGLELPAGKTVELKSGGYHVMLMDLKRTLAKNSTVPMTLRFKDAKGVESRLNISVPVSLTPPTMQPGAEMPAGEMHMH
jgi:copper(I)-binding protein